MSKQPERYEPRERYEWRLGTEIHPEFPAEEIPVAPQWVRNLVQVPQPGEYACLARDAARLFRPSLRKVCVDYLKAWEERGAKFGTHLIVAGEESHLRRKWAVSAVANEIVLRFSDRMPVSVAWCGIEGIRSLLRARERKDDYRTIEHRLITTRILLMLDPLRALTQEERILIEYIYVMRAEAKLPVFTTLETPYPDVLAQVRKRIGNYTAEILETSNHGFVANL